MLLKVNHPDVKDANGLICGGGVSVYYSHALQLLFFSFNSGKSFMAAVRPGTILGSVFPIQLQPKQGSKAPAQQPPPQPLTQWAEVPHHPGLVLSLLQVCTLFKMFSLILLTGNCYRLPIIL
jgi:E3 ubiquitin-protein ligase UBR4